MKIGVLALQGAFIEHIKMLRQLGAQTAEIRLPEQLDDLDGLIIPRRREHNHRQAGDILRLDRAAAALRAFAADLGAHAPA